jgi:hypothetical protein
MHIRLGSYLEARPGYQAAVKAQRAKEYARLHPEKVVQLSEWMVTEKVNADQAEYYRLERTRLTEWLLKAEYNSECPSGAVILEMNAHKHGFSVDDLKDITKRGKDVVNARHDTIVDINTRRPELSLPEIGRIMGGMDHSSVLYALRKRGIHTKTRTLFDPETARSLYRSGMTNNEIALAMGYAPETVGRATHSIRQERA